MHGQGHPQPVKQPPPTGWLVFLRVVFVALGLLSIGFLAWAMLLRLALVTRKSVDWGLFTAALALDALSMVLMATEPGDEIHTPAGWTGLSLLLLTLVVGMAYYLAADVRHFHQLRYAGYAPAPAGPAYGYPQPPSAYPYPAVAVPQPAYPTPPPMPQHSAPTPPPHPAGAGPARIDEVRAELDELSDYLRRHEGGR
ncbi:hypothetical protein [Streptomyces sp. NPDC003717]|uniref:hypothetical protein n=1 Tax=Streptomyces sp. NPDC003717 TaxID=3154276 RepID=UPI0033B623D9